MSMFNEFDKYFDDGSSKTEADYTTKTGYDLLNDRRAINDVKSYYAGKGITFSNHQDMWDQFYSDRRWGDVNTVSMIKDVGEYAFAGEDKDLHARLSKLWHNAPSRGTTWEKVSTYGTAGILDPTNLLGGWGAVNKAQKAYKIARAAGKTREQAKKAAQAAGMWSGATTEAAVGGAIGTGFDAAQQGMEIAQGVSDEFDISRAIISGGLDAGLSAVGGGAVGRYWQANNAIKDITNWRSNSTFGTTATQRMSELDREINSISADYDAATDTIARADFEDKRLEVEAQKAALLAEEAKITELDQQLDQIAQQIQAQTKQDPNADVSALTAKFNEIAGQRAAILETDVSGTDLGSLSGYSQPQPAPRPTIVEEQKSGVEDTNASQTTKTATSGEPSKKTTGTKATGTETKETVDVETDADKAARLRQENEALDKQKEGITETAGITKEAQDLLNKLEGGVLSSLNNNVKRILRANGIDVTPTTTPEEAINSLKAKVAPSVKPKAEAPKVELTPEETAILDQVEGVDTSKVQVKFKEAGKGNTSGRTLGTQVKADIEKGLITEDQVKKLFGIEEYVNKSGFPNNKWNAAKKLIVSANKKLKGEAPSAKAKTTTTSEVKPVAPKQSTIKKAITPKQKEYKATQLKAYRLKRRDLIGGASNPNLSNAWSTAKTKQEVDDVISNMEDYINGKETDASRAENAADKQADNINEVAKLEPNSFEAQEIEQGQNFFNKYWDESAGGAVNRGSYVLTRLADGVKKGNISGRVATIVRKMVKEAEEQVELGKKLEGKLTYEKLRAEALARGLGQPGEGGITPGKAKTYNIGKGATITTEARDRTDKRIAGNTTKAATELEEGLTTAGRTTVEYTRSDGTKVKFTKQQSILRSGFNVRMLDPEEVRTVLGINDIPNEAKFNIDAAKARADMDKDGGAVEGWADGQKLAYPFTATGVERVRAGVPREPGGKWGRATKGETYYWVPRLKGVYTDPYMILQSLGLEANFNVKQRGLYNGKLETPSDVINANKQVEKDYAGDPEKISAAKTEIDLKANAKKQQAEAPEAGTELKPSPMSSVPMSKEGKVLIAIPREPGFDAVRVASVKPGKIDGVAQADRPGMSADDLLGKHRMSPEKWFVGYIPRSLVEDEPTLRALKAESNRMKLLETFEPLDEANTPEIQKLKQPVEETNVVNMPPYEIGKHETFDTTRLTTDQENAFVLAYKTMTNPKATKAEIEKTFFGDGESKPTLGRFIKEDLWRWTEELKRTRWKAEINGVNVPLGQRINLLRELHGLLNDVAPGGLKKSNVDIEESVRNLRDIFSSQSAEELADMERVLRLTAKDDMAPKITSMQQLGKGTGGTFRAYARSEMVDGKAQLRGRYNHLSFTSQGTSDADGVKPSFIFAHELGHWVFHNLLDPSDIQKFFKAVGRHVDETGKLTNEGSDFLFSKAPAVKEYGTKEGYLYKRGAGANNWEESPGEHFANQFALYLHHHHDLMIVPDKGLWDKITRIVRSLWEKMTNKNILDKELEPLFAKIITNKDEFEISKWHMPAKEVITDGGRTYQARYGQWLESYRGVKLALEDDNPQGLVAYADELANTINGSTMTETQAKIAARKKQILAKKQGLDPESEAYRGYTGPLRAFDDDKKLKDSLRATYKNLKEMSAAATKTEFLPGEDMPTTTHDIEGIERLKEYIGSEEFNETLQRGMDKMNEQFLYLEGADIPEYIPSQELINLRKEKSIGSQRRTKRQKEYYKKLKASRKARLNETIRMMKKIGDKNVASNSNKSKGDYNPKEVDLVTALSEYPKYLDEAGVPNNFGKQLATRVKHLIATQIEPIDAKVGNPSELRQYTNLQPDQLIFRYSTALNKGNQGVANQVMYEMQQRGFYKNKSPLLKTTSGRVNDAIEHEIRVGTSFEEVGIPANETFKIRNILQGITNRTNELSLASRTVAHRLMLLGHEFNPQRKSSSYNTFRDDVRKIAANLTKKEDISQSVEMIARKLLNSNSFNDEKMATIRRASSEFGFEPEDMIAKLVVDDLDSSSDKAALKQLTEDMGEAFDSSLEEAVTSIRSEMREQVSYVMNGLIAQKGARKRFQNATVYGDMLGARSDFDPSSPSMHYIDEIPSEHGVDYASDLIRGMKPSTIRGVKSFTQTDDMTPYFVENLQGDSLFGNGIDITTKPVNTIRNSRDTILNTIPDKFRDYGEGLIDDLIEVREGIKSMRAFDRADPDVIAQQFDKDKAIVADLKRIGASEIPTARAVFIKDNNPLVLNKSMLGKDSNIVAVLEAIGANTNVKVPDGMMGNISPQEAYDYFISLAGDGMKLKEALRKAGYTSLTIGNSKSMIDPSNIKDIRSRDFVNDKFDMGVVPAPSDPIPFLIKSMANDNDMGSDAFIQLADMSEKSGIPSRVISVLDKARKKQRITSEDGAEIRKASKWSLTKTNAQVMRQNGMHHSANFYEPSNGDAGHFERVNARMGKFILPLTTMLKNLPDSPTALGRWFNDGLVQMFDASIGRDMGTRSTQEALLGTDGNRRSMQPMSNIRIVAALRNNTKARTLSGEEKKVYDYVRSYLDNARTRMREAGMEVGDIKENYFPQIWRKDLIEKNYDQFVRMLTRYFQKESEITSNFTRIMNEEDASTIAKRVANKLIDNDGIMPDSKHYADPNKMSITGKDDHTDFQRLIRLDTGGLKAFVDPTRPNDNLGQFLENDLMVAMTKYSDNLEHRLDITNKFGVGGFGFYDYLAVHDGKQDAISRLLSSDKVLKKSYKNFLNLTKATEEAPEGVVGTFTADVFKAPFPNKEATRVIVDELVSDAENGASVSQLKHKIMNELDLSSEPSLSAQKMHKNFQYRAEAIANALHETRGFTQEMSRDDLAFADGMMNATIRKPIDGSNGLYNLKTASKHLRSFNAVTLLGFTTLTSLGDLVLPLIRSGDFGSYRRALGKMFSHPVSGSAYRDMIRNVGAATENIVHDRMTKAFGVDNTKFTSGFFTATLLTNWTDMMRDVSAAVAFEHFKSQQRLALDFPGTKEGRLAKRQLEAYGLKRFYEDSSLNIDYIMETNGSAKPHDQYYTLSAAVHRFANQTIFTPNQNDQPLWAQTPTGQIIFQLKSFPLMMTRLGRDVFKKARRNEDGDRDLRPLLYFAGAGPAFGAVTTGTKDFVQSRGGEENRQMQLRDRAVTDKWEVFNELGMSDRKDLIAGWYIDGLMTMGGLGLIGQLFYDSAAQIDNGDYGAWRIAELFAGPSMGVFRDGIAVGAGAMEIVGDALGGDTTNAKERQMAREIIGRIPVAGQVTGVKEYWVDKLAGEKES